MNHQTWQMLESVDYKKALHLSKELLREVADVLIKQGPVE